MKLLAFDIWGDYAYFRRGYTTTSTLSYPFPSRMTVAGLVSSILGLERDSYYDLFSKKNSKIGIRILNPIKKVRFNFNYINTKLGFFLRDIRSEGLRTRVPAEFLKDPKFRIYISLNDSNLMNSLLDLLKNHKSIYTPCLGISECLANFKLVGDDFLIANKMFGENIEINSVVLKKKDVNIVIEPNKKFGLIKSPGFMNSKRVVQEYLEFYYEEKGGTIRIRNADYYRIGDDNVILF